jgi:hypothetical protein
MMNCFNPLRWVWPHVTGEALVTYFGGKGGGEAPAPDPNIGISQAKMAELADKQYQQWHDEIYPDLKRYAAAQEQRANDYYDLSKDQAAKQNQWGQDQHDIGMEQQRQALDTSLKNQGYADDYIKRMKDEFYPVEDSLVKDAMDYNTDGNVERQSGLAMGDVNAAAENQRKQNEMRMQSYGINPASGVYQGQQKTAGVQQAALAAAAGTRARDAAVQLGWAKKMDAASLGRGLPGNQATSTGLGLNASQMGMGLGTSGMAQLGAGLSAGQAGLNAGQIPFQNGLGLGNSAAQGYGGAMQGWNNVGNLGAQTYGIQSSNWRQQSQNDAAESAGVGKFIGTVAGGAMMMSDRRLKKNITNIGETFAGVPLYTFEYLWSDEKQVGVMADEVEKVFPHAVVSLASGYKMVNYSQVR